MSDSSKPKSSLFSEPSPLDELGSSKPLVGHVTTADGDRLHGYSVADDLAVHYSFAEVALLTLTGSAPDERTGDVFQRLLTFTSAVPIIEAPAHAARIARAIGSGPRGLIASAAAALTAAADRSVRDHREWLDWLRSDRRAQVRPATARGVRERRKVKILCEAFPEFPVLEDARSLDASYSACVLAALTECGLRRDEEIVACLTLARLPCTVAEALGEERGDLFAHPVNIPRYRYVEEHA